MINFKLEKMNFLKNLKNGMENPGNFQCFDLSIQFLRLSASAVNFRSWCNSKKMLFYKKLDFQNLWKLEKLTYHLYFGWKDILKCKKQILSNFKCLYCFLCFASGSLNPHSGASPIKESKRPFSKIHILRLLKPKSIWLA